MSEQLLYVRYDGPGANLNVDGEDYPRGVRKTIGSSRLDRLRDDLPRHQITVLGIAGALLDDRGDDDAESFAQFLRDVRQILADLAWLKAQVQANTVLLQQLANPSATPGPPVRAILSIRNQGVDMSATLTVDSVGEALVVGFVDDKGDVTAPPAGVVAAVSFDNPILSAGAFATVPGASTPFGDTLSAPLAITDPTGGISAPDVATATVVLSGAGGAALFEADGTTPFPQPAPLPIPVDPGAAVGAQIGVAP